MSIHCSYTEPGDAPSFDWDTANTEHLARHGVAASEAEQAILDPAAIALEIQSGVEERFKAVGMTTGGRIIVAIFTFRGPLIRPITAYDAPLRVQKLYLEQERT